MLTPSETKGESNEVENQENQNEQENQNNETNPEKVADENKGNESKENESKKNDTIPKASYNVVRDKYRRTKEELEKIKAEASKKEEEKLLGQKKYEELYQKKDEELKKFKDQFEKEKKRNAINEFAQKYKAKDTEVINRLIDFDQVKIDENGKVDKELIEGMFKDLKKTKEFLFEEKTQNSTIGSQTGGSPSINNQEPTTMKRSELPIDNAEWQKQKIHERIENGSLIIEDDLTQFPPR